MLNETKYLRNISVYNDINGVKKRMDYLTTAEFAEKWEISQRRVGVYCKEGRLDGAVIKGKTWLIPADSKKPEDPRKVIRNTVQCLERRKNSV